jgi:hypothetical protein
MDAALDLCSRAISDGVAGAGVFVYRIVLA